MQCSYWFRSYCVLHIICWGATLGSEHFCTPRIRNICSETQRLWLGFESLRLQLARRKRQLAHMNRPIQSHNSTKKHSEHERSFWRFVKLSQLLRHYEQMQTVFGTIWGVGCGLLPAGWLEAEMERKLAKEKEDEKEEE